MKPILVLVSMALGAAALGGYAQAPPIYDIVIRRGTVLDGTGLPRFKADVAILNGRIARVGGVPAKDRGREEIDANGLFVAPGFINIHSHASGEALPSAVNMLTQGVATEILNPDGGGPPDVAQQLTRLAERGLAVNVGAFVGFNSAWQNVMGPADRRPTADEIERMRQAIVAGLERGAWGVSAGLDYKPAYFAKTDEVIKVVEVARPWRTNFSNHDRITPESNYSSRTGIAETIAIGEAADLVPIVTHMKAQGVEQGTAAALVDLLRQATARAHYTAADAYPYLAGQSGLGALIIPAWAQDGGRDKMLERFADPAQRARIVQEAEQAMKARFGGPEGVYLPATGRELTDVMREMQVSGGEAVVRLLEQNTAGAILRFGKEEDLVKILQYPATSIACDCGATTSTRMHPRNYGTYPRVLGRYVRETKTLTWEEAVRKMSGLPATMMGMVDRGFLAPGMAADVTVFDPETVIDRATYEEPAKLSEGIRHVVVNGRVALRDGAATGEQAGRTLTRTVHMPSRAMGIGRSRLVSSRGTVTTAEGAEVQMTLDLAQPARLRNAAGTFRLTDARTNMTLELRDPGLLQVANRWASFTGRARLMPSKEERTIVVIIDQFDPDASGRPATVIVQTDGDYQLTGTIPASRVAIGR